MRLLLVSDWMSGQGGAERYATLTRDALRDAGDDVCLLACGPGNADSTACDARAYGTDQLAAQAFLQIVNPFAASRVRAVVRRFRPDVAYVTQFAYHLSPAALGALGRVPVVLNVLDYKVTCPTGTRLLPDQSLCSSRAGRVCHRQGCVGLTHWLRDQPRYALIRQAMSRADRVLCPSEWVRGELTRSGVAAECVPLGVSPPSKAFKRVASTRPTFVYCGRLSHEKGVTLLLNAFAALAGDVPDAQLRLVGDGPLRADLEDLAETLGVSEAVEFTGWLPTAQVEHKLSDAWALVAPSVWAEPFGLAPLEAIVRGIPAIASASGGFRETVEDGVTGILFQPGSVGQLRRSMRAVASGEAFPLRRIERSAVERATTSFGIKPHAQRLRAILAETAKPAARANRRVPAPAAGPRQSASV